ncbi:MAG: hypothetical protein AAGA93_26935 [Actinomycetota bacterium]
MTVLDRSDLVRRALRPTGRRLMTATATALAVRLVVAAGTILLHLVLARSLPINDVGRLTFGLTLAQIAAIAGRFGLENAVLRFAGGASETGRPEDAAAYAGLALRLVLVSGAAVTVVVWIAIAVLAPDGDRAHLLVVSTAITAWAAVFVLSAIHKAERRLVSGAVFESGGPSLVAAAIVVALTGLFDVELSVLLASVVVALSFAGFAAAGAIRLGPSVLGRRAIAGVDRSRRVAFARTSAPFAVIATIQTTAVWGGVLLLGWFNDDADVAGYSVALRALSIVILYRNLVVTIASPRLAGLHQGPDPARVGTATRLLGAALVATCLPPILLIALVPEPFLGLFGDPYRAYGDVLVPLAIGQVAATLAAAPQAAMAMTGAESRLQRIYLVAGSVGAAASVALTVRSGPVGTAWGQAVYWASLLGLTAGQYRRASATDADAPLDATAETTGGAGVAGSGQRAG